MGERNRRWKEHACNQQGNTLVTFPTTTSHREGFTVADPEGDPRVPWNPRFKENQKFFMYLIRPYTQGRKTSCMFEM